MLFLILVVLLIILALYYTLEDVYLLKFYKVPPGPISLPLIGGLYSLDKDQPHVSFSRLAQKYGKLVSLRFGTAGRRAVIIHDPHTAQQVFTNADVLDRPNIPYFELLTPHGAGIGSRPYDIVWKLHTRIIRSAINKIFNNSFSLKGEQSLEVLFKRWTKTEGTEIEIIRDLQLASLSFITNVCYGINFQDWSSEDMLSLLADNTKATEGLSPFHPINLCSVLKYLPLEIVQKIKGITQRRDSLLTKLYNQHTDDYTGKIHDIMDIAVDVLEAENNTCNLTHSQQQLIERNNLFMSFTALTMAGLDNLTYSLQWVILALASHPEITERIYQELQNNVSMDEMTGIEAKQHLPYTEATLMEIMRVVSLTALGVPHINRTEITVNGYKIPAGTLFFLNIWHIHNSEEYWENHDKLDPERFLDTNGQLKPKSDPVYKNFIPYGTGKRICIGNTLANNFLFMFVCNLVQKFSFKTNDKSIPLLGKCQMHHKANEFKVVFTKRATG